MKFDDSVRQKGAQQAPYAHSRRERGSGGRTAAWNGRARAAPLIRGGEKVRVERGGRKGGGLGCCTAEGDESERRGPFPALTSPRPSCHTLSTLASPFPPPSPLPAPAFAPRTLLPCPSTTAPHSLLLPLPAPPLWAMSSIFANGGPLSPPNPVVKRLLALRKNPQRPPSANGNHEQVCPAPIPVPRSPGPLPISMSWL